MNSSTVREIKKSRNLFAYFVKKEKRFQYHADLLRYLGSELAGKVLWEYLGDAGMLSSADAQEIEEICLHLNDSHRFYTKQFRLAGKGLHAFIFVCSGDVITVALKDLAEDIAQTESGMTDELTGLMSGNAYCDEIERIISEHRERSYAVFFFDVMKFKMINELYGFEQGNRLLIHIADKLRASSSIAAVCRIPVDRFSFLADVTDTTPDEIAQNLLVEIKDYNLPFEIKYNIGVYLVSAEDNDGRLMLDKAIMAYTAVKGNYAKKINYYTEELRDEILSEQEMLGGMQSAMDEGQFVVYYQPKYNHTTGSPVGAEALVRWMHLEKGLISPQLFIPFFEKSGVIATLDYYVFEKVCRFLMQLQSEGHTPMPISVNFSFDDIYAEDFTERLEEIRSCYGVPAQYLHIEVTERVLSRSSETVNRILHRLHDCGYIIELDDFGAGYSSLNTLKEMDVDILKLDMEFISDTGRANKGRIVLSSIIHMADQLGVPVIAEGVETTQQADFLSSLGCSCVQGYLYAKPMQESEFEELLRAN